MEETTQNEIQLAKHHTNDLMFIRPSSRVRPNAVVVICPSIRPVVRCVFVCPSFARPVAPRRRRRRPMPVRPPRCPSRRHRLSSVRASVRSFVRRRTDSLFQLLVATSVIRHPACQAQIQRANRHTYVMRGQSTPPHVRRIVWPTI